MSASLEAIIIYAGQFVGGNKSRPYLAVKHRL
jgi:hypothetical protein